MQQSNNLLLTSRLPELQLQRRRESEEINQPCGGRRSSGSLVAFGSVPGALSNGYPKATLLLQEKEKEEEDKEEEERGERGKGGGGGGGRQGGRLVQSSCIGSIGSRSSDQKQKANLVDFVLVYEKQASVDKLIAQRCFFEQNLRTEGLQLHVESEPSSRVCFVKIYAPFSVLCRRAQRLQIKVPMRAVAHACNTVQQQRLPNEPEMLMTNEPKWKNPTLFSFTIQEQLLIKQPTLHITAPFVQSRLDLYNAFEEEKLFSTNQRSRIVFDLLQRTRCDPNNKNKHGISWMLSIGAYKAAYPPHDGPSDYKSLDPADRTQWSTRQILRLTWANFSCILKPQPLQLIRSYFGEKIAFYFAWLGYYTAWLTLPGLFGLICFVCSLSLTHSSDHLTEICNNNRAPGNLTMCPVCIPENCVPWKLANSCESAAWNYTFDNYTGILMTVVTLTWAIFFLETWKRREASLAFQWDAFDVEEYSEILRPEYETEIHRLSSSSTIINHHEFQMPLLKSIFRKGASLSGVLLLISAVLLALVSLIVIRIEIYGLLKTFGGFWLVYQSEVTSMIIHLCTFAVVMTLGLIYEQSAHRLTDFECPRTQTDYLNSYIWKVFIFELLNNFGPIFYAALIRGQNFSLPNEQTHLKEFCDPGGCLNEPVQAIAILLLARLLISNAAELGYPLLKKVLKGRRLVTSEVSPIEEGVNGGRNQPTWRKDFALNEPHLDGVYAEYLEMMVQFGYVTLFVSVFPLAPMICLLNNIVEVRLDAINFVVSYRRPVPIRVAGIDTWHRCLNIILKLAIICNGAVLAFTSETLPKMMHNFYFKQDQNESYLEFTLISFNTTSWPQYKKYYPEENQICYYRDMYQHTVKGQQITIARLAVFIAFVMFFYLLQWLVHTLLPKIPSDINNSVKRANLIAREVFYGKDVDLGSLEYSSGVNENSSMAEEMEMNNLPFSSESLTSKEDYSKIVTAAV
ncbi:Anoctamin-3 [Trichinella zimbabwensis]|uniref:Anoctamin n=1 Tax=Trichinella zimbabwensis TaxID=268475 RepID=A0A0V1HGP8_9BILA|nr:Anoctamin-3 [Trichinella zimbabwensis]